MVKEIRNDLMYSTLQERLSQREDCSVITVECKPSDYSASRLAHAIEDSDAHLLDLLTTPGPGETMTVTLRLSHADPSAAVRSLERYDYKVVEAHGAEAPADAAVAAERLLSLQMLLSV